MFQNAGMSRFCTLSNIINSIEISIRNLLIPATCTCFGDNVNSSIHSYKSSICKASSRCKIFYSFFLRLQHTFNFKKCRRCCNRVIISHFIILSFNIIYKFARNTFSQMYSSISFLLLKILSSLRTSTTISLIPI